MALHALYKKIIKEKEKHNHGMALDTWGFPCCPSPQKYMPLGPTSPLTISAFFKLQLYMQ